MFSTLILSKVSIIYLFISIAFGTHFIAWGQEDTKSDVLFREDQVYLGASFMILQSNQKDFNPRGLSRHFQWGFIRDLPITSSGKVALGLGIGMSFERYNTDLKLDISEFNPVKFLIPDESTSPLFFSVHSLEIPLTLRWRNATANNFAFWRVYGGVSLRWNYYNKVRQETFELKNSNELSNFGTIAHLSFGYNTWNFYLAYHFNPFFKKTLLDSNNVPLEINPLKIGLIFYIL